MLGILKKLFGAGPSTDYSALMQRGAVVIDVRTPEEYQSGHVKQSKNIPLQQLGQQVAMLKKMGKPIITVCRSGARSHAAASTLQKAGIEVYNGGSWTSLQTKLNQA